MSPVVIFLVIISAVVYGSLRAYAAYLEERQEYPAMYSTDAMGNFGPTRPFWIENPKDGQLIKNSDYTDDGVYLNEKGIRLKIRFMAKNKDFGKIVFKGPGDWGVR